MSAGASSINFKMKLSISSREKTKGTRKTNEESLWLKDLPQRKK